MTQTTDLLALLRSRGTLGVTPLYALDQIGTLRLGARIFDLRNEGHRIVTHPMTVGKRKTVARYVLIQQQQLTLDV